MESFHFDRSKLASFLYFRQMIKKRQEHTILGIVLIGIYFFLGYSSVFFNGPEGIHFMRQSDSLAFASQYFNNGFDFFNPQLFNLKDIDGRAACEFPILYYFTALLYAVFGQHFFILKVVHLLVVYVGIVFLYKLIYGILKDVIYSVLILLFLFTSTVFNYYAFNYLPDIAALGFTFIGWYYFIESRNTFYKRTMVLSSLFFCLAGLLKVTYLISPLAILGGLVFQLFFCKKEQLYKKWTHSSIVSIVILLSVNVGWNSYMVYYNALYHATSFNTSILPIWKLNTLDIKIVWEYMTNYWYTKYFAASSFHILGIFFLFILVFYKQWNKNVFVVYALLLFGSGSYFILFYSQFKDHDYYFLVFLPLFLMTLVIGVYVLQKKITSNIIHIVIKSVLAVVVIAGINYSRMKLKGRYEEKDNEYAHSSLVLQKYQEEIKAIGISKNAKVIVATDKSQNGSLLILNTQGWLLKTSEELAQTNIESYKKQGASYLFVVNGEENLKNSITSEVGRMILQKVDLYVYKLQ